MIEIWEHINQGVVISTSYFAPELAQVDFPLKSLRIEKWEKLKESVGHDTRFWDLFLGNNRISAEILLIIVNSRWKWNSQRKSPIFSIIWVKIVAFGIFNVFSKSQRKWHYSWKINLRFCEKWPSVRIEFRFISGNESNSKFLWMKFHENDVHFYQNFENDIIVDYR